MSRARAKLPIFNRRRAVRLLAALSLALVLSATAGGPAGGAEEPFIRGSGKAEARLINVGPKAAKLSLAPTFGVALADYLNTLGRGESLVFDWVALEDSIPKEFRDEVPPLRAESTGPPECRDRVRTYPEGSPVGVMEQRSRATASGPYGESAFSVSSFGVPGALEISGAEARSTAGVLEGDIREATGTSEVGTVSLAEGTVTLKGLRWEAVHRSGGKDEVGGRFTVEAVNVGGVALPIPDSGELGSVIGPINEALKPLGIALRLPVVNSSGGVARITPLAISIFESPLRSQLFGPLLGGIQPVRQPLIDELFGLGEQIDEQTGSEEEVQEGDRQVRQTGCNGDPLPPQPGDSSGARDYAATSVLVTDITLGAVTGVSSLQVAVGGAQAFTEGTIFDSPFGTGGFRAPLPPVNQVIPGTPGLPGLPGTPGTDPREGSVVTTTRGGRTIPGDRGGLAILIGIVGLALAGALGVTDWYLIRRGRGVLPAGPSEA